MANKKDTDEPRYKGSELIRTATGSAHDVLIILLDPDATYTSNEVATSIQEFMQKEVS